MANVESLVLFIYIQGSPLFDGVYIRICIVIIETVGYPFSLHFKLSFPTSSYNVNNGITVYHNSMYRTSHKPSFRALMCILVARRW